MNTDMVPTVVISSFSYVLTVSLLLKDQSIVCANSSSKETGEFWGQMYDWMTKWIIEDALKFSVILVWIVCLLGELSHTCGWYRLGKAFKETTFEQATHSGITSLYDIKSLPPLHAYDVIKLTLRKDGSGLTVK